MTTLSNHWHGATSPALERFDDAKLLTMMQRVCDARPAARADSATSRKAEIMISSMQDYQAALQNTCSKNKAAPENIAAYLTARKNGGTELLQAELGLLRNTGDKKLVKAFDAMLRTGNDYLKTQPGTGLLGRVRTYLFNR